jgi:uncharacterized membrane protein YraQ (UPF0718 family)
MSVRLAEGLRYAFVDLLGDISKPFIIGIVIAGIITFFFPENLDEWANENRFLTMLVMLLAGIPMYVCATSSTPIAAALILKGLNPGAALVFLLAGPATNAATMAIVKDVFSTRALMIYLSMISVCSLAMGLLLDWVYDFTGIQPAAVAGQAGEIVPHSVELVSAFVLTSLILYNFYLHIKKTSR